MSVLFASGVARLAVWLSKRRSVGRFAERDPVDLDGSLGVQFDQPAQAAVALAFSQALGQRQGGHGLGGDVGAERLDRRHCLVETAHVDRYRAGRLVVVQADGAGEIRVDRRRDDMRRRELDAHRAGAEQSRLDLVRVVVAEHGSVALKAEVGDPFVGGRRDVDALQGRGDIDLGRGQGAGVRQD